MNLRRLILPQFNKSIDDDIRYVKLGSSFSQQNKYDFLNIKYNKFINAEANKLSMHLIVKVRVIKLFEFNNIDSVLTQIIEGKHIDKYVITNPSKLKKHRQDMTIN